MNVTWRSISKSPGMLLLTGFCAGAIIVAALAVSSDNSTEKQDPIFDALTGRPRAMPGWPPARNASTPDSPTAQSHAATVMPQVASLSDLLPRLEARVAANPDDPDQQLLLAQTYLELDQRKNAEVLFSKLQSQFPEHDRLPFLRAKMLMQSDVASDLQTAVSLFDESVRRRPAAAHLARLYQGQVLVRLGEHEQAIAVWQNFLDTLPAGDERRTVLEAELKKVSASHNDGSPS